MPAASATRVARAAHTYRLTATVTPRLIETPYADGPTILGGTLTQLCLEAAHSRSWAVAAPGQSRVVPAAGTSWNTRLGGSADLFIAEATDHQRSRVSLAEQRMHLTSREAGEAARDAGARRLMLTHFWPDNDRQSSEAAAREGFDGEILLADESLAVALN